VSIEWLEREAITRKEGLSANKREREREKAGGKRTWWAEKNSRQHAHLQEQARVFVATKHLSK
jgi:hypothetical protein